MKKRNRASTWRWCPRTSTCASRPRRWGSTPRNWLTDKIEISELYEGHCSVTVEAGVVESIYQHRELPLASLEPKVRTSLFANEFVMLVNEALPSQTALSRVDVEKQALVLLRGDARTEVYGVHPANREQRYALEILLDDRIKLVTLAGKAGTGKTLLAIAAGLQKVINEKAFRRLAVYRPVIPMGKDIGYLPGSEQDKLAPWMQPIFDNLEYLLTPIPLARARVAASLHPPRTASTTCSTAACSRSGAHLHPRPQPAQPLHHHRRGAEPHPPRGQDHRDPRGRGGQAGLHGRSLPD